jgi:2,5-diamino-6-(ribosylamino)-4(3H)-pyrimidinone 5'-phosphate reductase
LSSKVLNDEAKTLVAVSKAADEERIRRVSQRAEVAVFGEEKVDLSRLLEHLFSRGVRRVMVEGGGTLISSLVSGGLVDEMRIYFAPMVIGGSKSPTICDGSSRIMGCRIERVERVGEGFAVFVKF